MDLKRILRMVMGISYLVIGGLSFLAVILLISFGMYPQALSVLYFEITCMTAAFMGVLLGLESISFPVKDKRGDRNSLVYDLILSVCLGILLIITANLFRGLYSGSSVMESETDTWDDNTLLFYGFAYIFAHIAAILFFLSLLPLGYLLYKNKNEQ